MMRNLLMVWFCSLVVGCGGGQRQMSEMVTASDVEIAPGSWLRVEHRSTVHQADAAVQRPSSIPQGAVAAESSGLTFEWQGRRITWSGKEIPVTLREWEESLYMVGFDRTVRGKNRLVFFSLSKQDNRFHVMDARKFPRRIATQNMWLAATGRWVNIDGAKVDTWDGLKRLDVANPSFDQSLTAYMWYQIENDVELHAMPRLIEGRFLKQYVESYSPIALPTLVKMQE